MPNDLRATAAVPRRAAVALALIAAVGACAAAPAAGPDPVRCAALFARYDAVARHYPVSGFREDGGDIAAGQLSRPTVALRANGCLTTSADLDGLPALAARLQPFAIADSGPAIPPTPVHLGVVTGIADEALVTRAFRGLGYRSRGVGAEGLGRRLYIGVFTTQGALDQALAVAREAGFVAPYAARFTRF